jgi:hypothetical protein
MATTSRGLRAWATACGDLSTNRREPAGRDHHEIRFAQRAQLRRSQFALAEVAQVATDEAVELKAEDGVRSKLGPCHPIVLRGDRDDVAHRRIEPARGGPNCRPRTENRLGAVMVKVLVGDEQQVGGPILDRGYSNLSPIDAASASASERNGSIMIVRSPLSRNADCPYQRILIPPPRTVVGRSHAAS